MSDLTKEFEDLFDSAEEVDDSLSVFDIDEGDINALAHLYDGSSAGFKGLVEGYSAYAFETMQNRAFPDVRDGLKPVQRRIVFALGQDQKKFSHENSSLEVISQAYPWHPHGDSAIYGAAVRMTDKNKSFMIPLLRGGGNVGSVIQPGSEAAPRYSKMWMHDNIKDFTRDMDGAFWKPAEADETKVEPAYLPVRYPFVLCNPAMGIAVGMATNIPAYNFFDVINLTIKYLKGEDITHEVMAPDFPTGGFVLKDDKEFLKILNIGHGKVHIRARVEISDRQDCIEVHEIPYGKTRDSIIAAISNIVSPPKDRYVEPINGLKSVSNFTGRDGNNITIDCARGTAESVLLHLYKRGILQTNFTARLNVVNGNMPIIGGIPDILEAWYASRERVLARVFKKDLEGYKQAYIQYSYFMRLVSNEVWKDEYLRRITKVSTPSADEYLREIFDDIPADVVTWINHRRAAEFNRGGKYKDLLDATRKGIEEAKYNSQNIKEYVIKDLESLKTEHSGRHPRVSELTSKAYKFIKVSQLKSEEREELIDDTPAWFTVTTEGLLYKTRDSLSLPENEVLFQGVLPGNAVLIGFDIYGRILRFYGEQYGVSNAAVNLADYFEVPIEWRVATSEHPQWHIQYLTNLDEKKRYIFYNNGKLSVLNTAEYGGKSVRRRINQSGMPADIVEHLFEIIHEDDMPEVFVGIDDAKSTKGGPTYRVGWQLTSEIRDTSSVKAEVRLLGGAEHLLCWTGITEEELSDMFHGLEDGYEGRVKRGLDSGILTEIANRCDYGSYAE